MKILRLVISSLIVILIFLSPVSHVNSDAKFQFLVPLSIIENKTIAIDNFCDVAKCDKESAITKINNHYYYYFPLGTPLLTTPFILVLKFLGIDCIKHYKEIQLGFCILTLLAIYWLMLKIGDIFLNPNTSTLIATIFIFGTSFISTLGNALWSHNFCVVFSLASLYFYLSNRKYKISICSFLVFLSYLCRPTMSLFFVSFLVFVFLNNKKDAVKFFLYTALFFINFVLFCEYSLGSFLPLYYLPSRLSNADFLLALYGILFSPSRGLFLFSPFLLYLFFRKPRQAFNHWWIFGLVWPLMHIFTVARFPVWWGGVSFGPRLLVDCIPGFFISAICLWPKKKDFIFMLLCYLSIYINTYQGKLHLKTAVYWNGGLIDAKNQESKVLSWHHPQLIG